jgi:hypothetical protein
MVHVYDPLSGVLVMILAQLNPLFVEYWIFTYPLVPEDVQVMSWLLPIRQFSPPLGEPTVMKSTSDMVNSALLWSDGLPSTSVTLTRHVWDGMFGIVHEYVPSSGVLAMIVDHVNPLFVVRSIFTFPLVPPEFHLMS